MRNKCNVCNSFAVNYPESLICDNCGKDFCINHIVWYSPNSSSKIKQIEYIRCNDCNTKMSMLEAINA